MNWAGLKKEHKQLIILGAVVVVGVLAMLYLYVLAPSMQSGGETTGKLAQVRQQLGEAGEVLQHERTVRADYLEAVSNLTVTLDRYVTPVDNPLSWVTENIYRQARAVGVDVESVAEVGAPGAGTVHAKKAFLPYSVRLVTQCSYADLLLLITALERTNPYLCIIEVNLTAQDRNLLRHQVALTVEWPVKVVVPASAEDEKNKK